MIINGKEYETFVDSDGVHRFKPNNLLLKLKIDLDISIAKVVRLYELGAITQMDLLDYYAGLGYSVCGVQELTLFEGIFEQ